MQTSAIVAPAALSLLIWTIAPTCAQPFQASTASLTNASNTSGFGLTLTTVPAGKLLVIEFLSAACNPTGTAGVGPKPAPGHYPVGSLDRIDTGKYNRTSGSDSPDPNICRPRKQSKSDVIPYNQCCDRVL